MTPRMSSSRIIRCSSPSTLISVPPSFERRTGPQLLSAPWIAEFFRELPSLATETQRARVHQATELYLASLLSGSLQTESLLVREEDGSLQRRPLALLFKEALEEEGAARAR